MKKCVTWTSREFALPIAVGGYRKPHPCTKTCVETTERNSLSIFRYKLIPSDY